MAFAEKLLGQLRPSDTNAASIYSPAAGITGVVKTVVVVNTEGTNSSFRLFVDNTGTTYDKTTAQFYDTPILANNTIVIDTYWVVGTGGNIAVRSANASTLTFTVHGAEIS